MKKALMYFLISVLALSSVVFGAMLLTNGDGQSSAIAMTTTSQSYNSIVTSKIYKSAKSVWREPSKALMQEGDETNGLDCAIFLPEGFTGDSFQEYILVQNPNDYPVYVEIIFMTSYGPVFGAEKSMDSMTRWTVCVNDILPDEEVSTMVLADDLVLAERAMYADEWTMYGAHDSIGYLFYPLQEEETNP